MGISVSEVQPGNCISTEFDGWSLLLDPTKTAKLRDCGVSMVDSQRTWGLSALSFAEAECYPRMNLLENE